MMARAMGVAHPQNPFMLLSTNTIIVSRGHNKNSRKSNQNVMGLLVSSSSYSISSSRSSRRRMLVAIHSAAATAASSKEEERMDGKDESNNSSHSRGKPVAAEVSRTIMELSSVATLSVLTTHTHPPQQEQVTPLGFGVRFAVDHQGTPFFSLNHQQQQHLLLSSSLSTLHVQFEQCGLRTPQCTIQGTLARPHHQDDTKKLQSIWQNRFHQQLNQDLLYVLSVQRVLQIEDFMEDGVWFTSSEYKSAVPDPLRDSAEHIVHEINTHHMEDIHRFCNIYVDLNFQVSDAKMVWVDRLGFDLRLSSPQNDVFEVRIPFPREVADEKGAKSSFNCMSQLAWEMEKNYHSHDFNKVKQLKKIACRCR